MLQLKLMKSKNWVKYLWLINFVIFVFLLARNPFGQRTLIPNLEPYPDTFHYIVPARNFVQGGDFAIARGFGSLKPGVPPLYSLTLLPFYFLNSDARMFYIANVMLSLASFYLFYLILKKVSTNFWLVSFALFLFATNFFIYWYPQWAMAENLILPLFLAGMLLLLEKVSMRNTVLAGLVAVSFYAAKYAAVPLSGMFFVFYLLKILFTKNLQKTRKKIFATYLVSFGIAAFLLLIYLQIVLGTNPFASLIGIANSLFFESTTSGSGQAGTSWFSFVYISKNLPLYLRGLAGNPARFMWDFTPILPKWLALLGILGLVWGVFFKKFRFLALALIFLSLGQVVFISSFYSVDMRYIYPAIPTLLFGVALFFSLLDKRVLYLVLALAFLFYFATNALRLKNQVVLNLKYAETPWSYISVLKLNEFFSDAVVGGERPIVISPLPPFYIDFFSNGNYDPLPLSSAQEFRSDRHLVWGPGDYSDLHELYKSYLREGRQVYVATYGLGIEGYLHAAFTDLNKDFKLTEVDNDCWEQCRIYRVGER
jgi:hypothetical protein